MKNYIQFAVLAFCASVLIGVMLWISSFIVSQHLPPYFEGPLVVLDILLLGGAFGCIAIKLLERD